MILSCNIKILYVGLCLWYVSSQDHFDSRQPHIHKHPIHHNVSKDDTLKLSCWVYGDPRPVIRWIKNNKFLATNNRTLVMADGSLVIDNVQHSDEGIYKCRAENDYGAVESEAAKVRFYYISDAFFADPLDNNVMQFDNFTLMCRAPNGFPTPTVTWTFNEKPLGLGNWEVSNFQYDSFLQLKIVTWRNHGKYQCRATNVAGHVISKSAVVKVKVPAPVIVNSKTLVEVYSGKTVKLTCKVQYYKLFPDREWKKLNGVLPLSRVSEPKDEDGVLIIKDTQLSDSGKYKCNVSNDAGSDTSTSKLIVYEPPTIEDLPFETSIAQGYTFKLTCKVFGGKDPVVTWNFLGNMYERERMVGFKLPRIYVDKKYQLVVRKANLSDKGEVYCMVEDMGESFKSNTMMLNVNVPPPRVTVSPTNISNVREGGQFMMTCSATGEDLLYAWHHFKQVLNNSPKVVVERVDGGNRLTVNNARIVDSGVYRCVVEGTGGSSSEKSHVAIISAVVFPLPVTLQKTGADEVVVRWTPPEGVNITGYLVSCMQTNGATFNNASVNARVRKFLLSGVDPSVRYVVVVIATTAGGSLFTSEKQVVVLRLYAIGDYINAITTLSAKPDDDDTGSVIQEPWFIASAIALLVLTLVLVVMLVLAMLYWCKNSFESSQGFFNASGMADYANASLSRGSIELRGTKSSNLDVSIPKEYNVGVAMRNGYMVDTPLNNEDHGEDSLSNSCFSSPSRLSGISSEGSLYTAADYECPLVLINPVPLSSARNSMDKIDQVLAQRSKLPNNKRQQQEFIPQISMSNYLTGSSRGPNSVSSSIGIPPSRAPRNMYGAGRGDVETASNSSKKSKKPLTMSNLNAEPERALLHLSSLETARNKLAPPEPFLSVTSALERHASVSSKESINSSSKQDSEVENKPGTAKG